MEVRHILFWELVLLPVQIMYGCKTLVCYPSLIPFDMDMPFHELVFITIFDFLIVMI